MQLNARTRSITGKKVNNLRRQNIIPVVLYGHNIQTENLEVNYGELEKIYNQAGESTLVDLKIDDKEPVKVLIYDSQWDPQTDRLLHVDFFQVRMDEEITAEVELKFEGESKAVKEGGMLIKNFDSVEIECLPNDLIHFIEVDLGALKNIGDAVLIKDLKVPPTVKILKREDETVVTVIEPQQEEAEPAPSAGEVKETAKAGVKEEKAASENKAGKK